MKLNVVVLGAALAAASVSCTKSKKTDAPAEAPAPAAPAPQGQSTTTPPPPPPATQTTTGQQQQWQQQQQQGQQMPTAAQPSFTMRLRTNIVGEPNTDFLLVPGMRDSKGIEVELPVVTAPIVGPNNTILIPEGARVWGTVTLTEGGQSSFKAGGFLMPNNASYATVATGVMNSKDYSKQDWATTGWNTLKGTLGGAALGTILSLTTGDKKVQAWEILAAAGGGGVLMTVISLFSSGSKDPVVQIEADGTNIPIFFNLTDVKTVPGYKVPPAKAPQAQQQAPAK